ncbi:MAG: ABC transporter permease/substrate-binding protein [Sphingomonas sp.]|uniref:ABC transporter permease/substrate-binding protein n=1 Tax=Sphingomonas sp. TaxID=28214 RepID=UPI001AD2906A|nr:ABC transporter permease/substrate-binding protein [Sphingomonas sp.]MBN8808947.1 ABC transporter permease/substrate-binding protein [Sphingomonas sp.]
MTDFLDALSRAPDLLAQHLLLAFAALALGIVVSLPLAVVSARVPVVGRVALGLASLIQTIPSLALLALFYPLLLSLSALVGGGIPALGFLPSLLALTLYAVLPILRNGVTGLAGIDPAVIEAADGVGMTRGQKLRLVEAPLVAPVVMAGIRTAAVWTIGAATLSTTVGQPSLGDMIFAGLQTQNWALVLAGCFAAATLALAVDALLGVIERGIARRKRARVWLALGVLAAGVAVALAPMLRPLVAGERATVTVGAKGFSEQYILARLIGHRLEAAGYRVRYKEGLGSGVLFAALAARDVDVAVDYSGTVWANEMKRTDTPPRDAMLAALTRWEAGKGLTLLGRLGFENAYAFAMRHDRATALGIATLDDLAAKAGDLKFGADLEFLERPEWRAVRDAYAIRFGSANAYNPTFMYRALASGQADVISAFSSDGRIAADRLTVLRDPKGAIPNYDAILTIAKERSGDARFVTALRPLIGRVPVEAMREANYMVDRDVGKVSPDAAARWLEKRVGL